MENKTLGSFIATLRKERNFTQKDLAEKLNVSDKAVSRWERDESAPDITLLPTIAEVFGVTCDELLKGERSSTLDSGTKAFYNLSIIAAVLALGSVFIYQAFFNYNTNPVILALNNWLLFIGVALELIGWNIYSRKMSDNEKDNSFINLLRVLCVIAVCFCFQLIDIFPKFIELTYFTVIAYSKFGRIILSIMGFVGFKLIEAIILQVKAKNINMKKRWIWFVCEMIVGAVLCILLYKIN